MCGDNEGNETEEVFGNRKVSKEHLKVLTGRMMDRNRELVSNTWSLVRKSDGHWTCVILDLTQCIDRCV